MADDLELRFGRADAPRPLPTELRARLSDVLLSEVAAATEPDDGLAGAKDQSETRLVEALVGASLRRARLRRQKKPQKRQQGHARPCSLTEPSTDRSAARSQNSPGISVIYVR